MQSQKHFKPGTKKLLSPRVGDYSPRWGRLVLQTAALPETKEFKKHVVELWRAGYSHRDAAHILIERYMGLK